MFPYCEHRACHACRSTFRDRTWLRFGNVFNDRTNPSIDFEYDNRPLSSPAIVASLGISQSKRHRQQRPLLQTFDSMGIHRARSAKRALEAANSPYHNTNEVTERDDEFESKGIRSTIKRAFREMLTSRRESVANPPSTPSTRSSLSSARPSRKY